jgi:hypothetical protein
MDISNTRVPPLPSRYGMLSLIKCDDAGGGWDTSGEVRIEAT